MIIVVPIFLLYCLKASSTRALAPISIPLVGSETNIRLGSSANVFARHIFCWLPPESSFAFCFDDVHLICNCFMYFSVTCSIALLSLHFINRYFFRNMFWLCMAVNDMFHSRLSSSSNPTPRLSSETNASRWSRHDFGLFKGIFSPLNSILPPAG